ncbi:hypothetical protein D3C77_331140 [compost metagenome]
MKAELAVNKRTVKFAADTRPQQAADIAGDTAEIGKFPDTPQYARQGSIKARRWCGLEPLQAAFESAFDAGASKGFCRQLQAFVFLRHLFVEHRASGFSRLEPWKSPTRLAGQYLLVALGHDLHLPLDHHRGADEALQFRGQVQAQLAQVESWTRLSGQGQRPAEAVGDVSGEIDGG